MESISYCIAEDQDFQKLKTIIEEEDDWNLEFDKGGIRVWTKESDNNNIKIVKVVSHFENVNALDLYDVIHDPDYRKVWDHSMLESIDIGHLNPNNDISYYAVSCPAPMKNRDFVLQRSWLDMGDEQYILNHSVFHKDFPPRRGFTRAISLFTGYLITNKPNQTGCTLGYVTQSDLQSDLPQWLVNKCTQLFAPKYVRQLEKAALGYSSWKASNQRHIKPWHYPEQITSPKLPLRLAVTMGESVVAIVKPAAGKSANVVVVSTASLLDKSAYKSASESASRSAVSPDGSSLHEDSHPHHKLRLFSCLNFTKRCIRKKRESSLP